MRWSLLLVLPLLWGCAARCPERYAPACHQWPWERPGGLCMAKVGGCFPTLGTPAVIPDPDYELDLCLLIDIALQNSAQTRITWAEARAAAADFGISLADFYPDVNGTPYVSYGRDSTFFGQGQLVTQVLLQYGPMITLSYLVMDFGARCARAQAMFQALREANFVHDQEILSVMQGVTDAYYAYQGSIGRVEGLEGDLVDAQILLDAAVAKRISGVTDRTDELAARTKVAQVELQLLQEQKRMEEALTTLSAELGIPANCRFKVEPIPKEIPLANIQTTVEDYIRIAYAERPDLKAAYADLLSKQQLVKAAKADRWPKLVFSGEASRDYFNSGKVTGIDFFTELKLNIPLFKGFYYRNKIKLAQANLAQSCANLRQTEISMVEEVVRSYREFLVSTGEVSTSVQYVDSATGSYKARFLQYLAGTVDFTTVSDALAQLSDARAALATSKEAWYTSLTDLSYATGTISRCDSLCANTPSAPYGLLQAGGACAPPAPCEGGGSGL
ncbi:MAG: TolC family protein [Parachlamydiales bacterium]